MRLPSIPASVLERKQGMGLRTLIVDDEPIARRVLREELEQFEEIEIAGEAANGAQALAALSDLAPDLVFLDLQMPGMTGFDVIRKFPPRLRIPMFVIVTAYDQHAIEAFEAGAIDYLLKPIGQERVAQAVDRAIRFHAKPALAAGTLAALQEVVESKSEQPVRRIVARSGDEYLLLNPSEVLAFEADGDLVWIITARKRHLATQPLRTIQEKLHDAGFRRIHRKAVINIDHVRKMSPMSSQRWLVTLSNGQEFIVSKRQAQSVRRLLSW